MCSGLIGRLFVVGRGKRVVVCCTVVLIDRTCGLEYNMESLTRVANMLVDGTCLNTLTRTKGVQQPQPVAS